MFLNGKKMKNRRQWYDNTDTSNVHKSRGSELNFQDFTVLKDSWIVFQSL